MRRPAAALFALTAILAAAGACSSSEPSGPVVSVVSTDTECRVGPTALSAGAHTFEVRNSGGSTTEVYIYAPGDKVITEKENIGPGTATKFNASLKAGTYEVACKPGQKGSGIRQTLTVA